VQKDVKTRNHRGERVRIAKRFTVVETKDQAGKWIYQLRDERGELFESGKYFRESELAHVY
jgi:hypothetical protein